MFITVDKLKMNNCIVAIKIEILRLRLEQPHPMAILLEKDGCSIILNNKLRLLILYIVKLILLFTFSIICYIIISTKRKGLHYGL